MLNVSNSLCFFLLTALLDAMHAVLCGAGHNVRLILNKLKCGNTSHLAY
jgi:hypothetical protein